MFTIEVDKICKIPDHHCYVLLCKALFDEDTLEKDLPNFHHNKYGEYTKVHQNGWTVTAIPEFDFYVFITSFMATHPFYGDVWSLDTNKYILADSEEGFTNFKNNFSFDLCDI